MDLDVLFVGTAGAAPSSRRGLPATVVRRGGERLLFDCGEGTQRQLMRSIGLVDFEEVFLTHYHADHVLGLPGMLKSFALRQRERPLTIYGPPGLGSFWRLLDPIVGRLPFKVTLQTIAPNDELGATATGSPPTRSTIAASRSGTRSPRTRGPACSIPTARAAWASRPAPTSAAFSAARRWTASAPTR